MRKRRRPSRKVVKDGIVPPLHGCTDAIPVAHVQKVRDRTWGRKTPHDLLEFMV